MTHPALVLVGTPIGNLDDASPRMRAEIETADVIAAEDTRRFMGLASRLGITYSGTLVSLFDHNERSKAGEIAQQVENGARVVLLTDAGMPAVSDPGYHVVKEVVSRDLPVTAVPGPSAVFTAVALSGLPSDRFTFEGFVPRKAGERGRLLTDLASERRTMVFFESPHRIQTTLADFVTHFGADRPMTLSRELTKTYEETLRGTTQSIHEQVVARDGLKGELTLVVAGAPEVSATSAADLTKDVAQLVESGMRAKDAAAHIAKIYGLKSRDVYEEYIHAK
ncbi:16S rRNA (cytidine(1402)-2'-O)-methyltransferase [Brevibacterium paucivorans]|uniref:Ribosomal RNA small subunit methyltransferase I n=1 Tax=Brevibacterium paucivorans TaxID=170994 RepID=A0A2N6VMF8_9MICO|nr:16S rRNA (cytidine(1402)-2'-O)-methyltransferase [Brevibacterium paucivorans]PMD05331.1 16S rRNA (cytidine(1402)-2'-O)-methyltransferase [Brevibacterium paucivorans]